MQNCSCHLSYREVGTISKDGTFLLDTSTIHFIYNTRPRLLPPSYCKSLNHCNPITMPNQLDPIVESTMLQAIRQLLAAQTRYWERMQYTRKATTPAYNARNARNAYSAYSTRNARALKEPSIYNTTRRFKAKKSVIRRYLKALKETSIPTFSICNIGRLYTLRPDKELALEIYAYQLIETNYPLIVRNLIKNATNQLYIYYILPKGPVSKK